MVAAPRACRRRAASEAQTEKEGDSEEEEEERHDSGVHGASTWLCLVWPSVACWLLCSSCQSICKPKASLFTAGDALTLTS